MKPPTAVTKFVGQPRVAAVLYVTCGLLALGWAGGHIAGWLALAALCFAVSVQKAVQDLRRYNEWQADWSAMGNRPAVAVEKRKAVSPWRSVLTAALYLIIIPLFIAVPQATEPVRDTLAFLWLGIAGYLLWKVAAICSRQTTKSVNRAREEANGASTASGVVECVLPLPLSPPSRIDALRGLPGYCARLIVSH
jgi:hypothetical protein